MKLQYTALRRYMHRKVPASPHSLENCHLVIDGDSFFKNTYKDSGCQFFLGPECDKYADYIKNKLNCFLTSKITCYVIFNGVTKLELEKKEEIHQRIIANRNDVEKYFQPLFVQDVQKEVLDELEIKYFVCLHDSIEAIVGVARKFKCPVMTDNIEYCLFGVSCIQPNSVNYPQSGQRLKCAILECEIFKTLFGVYSKMPILLTLLNENGDYIEILREVIACDETRLIPSVVRLVKSHREEDLVSKVSNSMDDENRKEFLQVYEKIQTLYLYPSCNLAVKYFQRKRPYSLYKDDKKWFAKGVANGRIAIPYINLKEDRVICGSRLPYYYERPDALLAAKDIILYADCLLKSSQDSAISFIGRRSGKSLTDVSEIETYRNKNYIFAKPHNRKRTKLLTGETDLFQNFLEEILLNSDTYLEAVPKDCWLLIITLAYYISKKNKDFMNAAYSVLLSYLMLGPISEKLNMLNVLHSESKKDYVEMNNGLKFLFKSIHVERKCIDNNVHSFIEFQHCLQHMNYLNKLCGEKIPCTVYSKTYNATLIHNSFLSLGNKYTLMRHLEVKLNGSKMLLVYKNLVTAFENCLSAVK